MCAPKMPDILIVVTVAFYIYVAALGQIVRKDRTQDRIHCHIYTLSFIFSALPSSRDTGALSWPLNG
jgi:hypothetical protein